MAAGEHQIELAATTDAQRIDSLARDLFDPALAVAWHEMTMQAMANSNANVAVVRDGAELSALGIIPFTIWLADRVFPLRRKSAA